MFNSDYMCVSGNFVKLFNTLTDKKKCENNFLEHKNKKFQKSSLKYVLTYMCEGKGCLSFLIHLTVGSDWPSALQKILLFEPSSSLVLTGGGRNFSVSVKYKRKRLCYAHSQT